MAEKIENIELRDKYTTAVSLIHGLSTVELDFVITSIKSMRRLMKKAEYVDFEAGEQ